MDGIFICHVLGWKMEKSVIHRAIDLASLFRARLVTLVCRLCYKNTEPSVSKFSYENMMFRIFTQKHDKLKYHPLMKKFHPLLFSFIKIMDEKILSLDKRVIHGGFISTISTCLCGQKRFFLINNFLKSAGIWNRIFFVSLYHKGGHSTVLA